jgi:hypothetical protein
LCGTNTQQVCKNGVVDPSTGNATLLLYCPNCANARSYAGPGIYQLASGGAWYVLNSASWPAGGNGYVNLGSNGDPR